MELRNRLWRGIQTVTVLSGLDPAVGAEPLRAALRRLHAADPTARVVCRLTGRPPYWTPVPGAEVDAWLERLVVDDPDVAGRPGEELVESLLRRPAGDLPFSVTVAGGRQAWRIDHVLADGSYALRHVVGALTRAAASGEVPIELLPTADAVRRPLLHSAWGMAREPKLATWRTALQRAAGGSSGGGRAVPATGTRTETALVIRSGAPGTVASLREWGEAHAPGVSTAVLVMTAARRALERHGVVPPETDTVVMFDCRRYLPRAATVEGNFVAALRLTDPSCRDPYRTAEQMASDVSLGLPLVSLLAATAGEALSPVRAALARSGARPAARGPVVLSHLGSLGHMRRLPWVSGGTPSLLAAAAPSDPTGITVITTEWGKALNASMTYGTGRAERYDVAAAATDLVTEPWALVAEATGR
ncbi:hypothetical protein [Modestobacter roseus]|uniref:hypothetical protein n=1 Tax=Modestobacter roseus TaxID=1181884 RepID=UPI0034DE4BCC